METWGGFAAKFQERTFLAANRQAYRFSSPIVFYFICLGIIYKNDEKGCHIKLP